MEKPDGLTMVQGICRSRMVGKIVGGNHQGEDSNDCRERHHLSGAGTAVPFLKGRHEVSER
eukprot:CAMPEP_0206608476 /NCGR_PEP_ID=MMETSP0325_2-20121206/53044_1 /ASSEMBLY_ACC=CAM_ASM_000347 /TAXON_ID=2866 /ORGANISM="Crypthecodinium cohnii, Strain Seligo" /LENGTH=60 /DNA_ID=CAMNT_0054126239 /DNA_START=38 /DNA_END=217 /DNA_ORIENTATION=-